MSDTPTLHIYSQPYEHADARIVGNRAGLSRLALALSDAIMGRRNTTTGSSSTQRDCVFASDGEGYEVKIIVMPDEVYDVIDAPGGKRLKINPEWEKYPPHYCDRGYADDTHKEGT